MKKSRYVVWVRIICSRVCVHKLDQTCENNEYGKNELAKSEPFRPINVHSFEKECFIENGIVFASFCGEHYFCKVANGRVVFPQYSC